MRSVVRIVSPFHRNVKKQQKDPIFLGMLVYCHVKHKGNV